MHSSTFAANRQPSFSWPTGAKSGRRIRRPPLALSVFLWIKQQQSPNVAHRHTGDLRMTSVGQPRWIVPRLEADSGTELRVTRRRLGRLRILACNYSVEVAESARGRRKREGTAREAEPYRAGMVGPRHCRPQSEAADLARARRAYDDTIPEQYRQTVPE